jgi:hypothetical protein
MTSPLPPRNDGDATFECDPTGNHSSSCVAVLTIASWRELTKLTVLKKLGYKEEALTYFGGLNAAIQAWLITRGFPQVNRVQGTMQ